MFLTGKKQLLPDFQPKIPDHAKNSKDMKRQI